MKKPYRVRIFLIVLTLFLLEETIRLGISSILADDDDVDSLESALALNPSDAQLNFRLAKAYHLLMLRDEREIEALYVRSLRLNPVLSSSWLGLAEIFDENGEREKALTSLRRTVELGPLYIGRLWEASILALKLGEDAVAAEYLRTVARVDATRRTRVFDASWQLIGDPELILNQVVPDEALPDYLRYLIVGDNLVETFPVWDRMARAGMVANDIALFYVDFLLKNDRSSEALSIWEGLFGKRNDGSLVWNGGFEDEPVANGWGFDWKIHRINGVAIEFDRAKKYRGSYSLRLNFDGADNVDFYHVSQIVPVEPDTDYVLTSYISTDEITTKNGISWEVFCYPRFSMVGATGPITGTTDWERVELSFRTSPDCKSVGVRLRRYKSDKIDKYISGTAWVDDVEITKVGLNSDAQGR